MNTVGRILKTKGSTVCTIPQDALVSEALKLFVEKRISSVIAMEGDKVAGIFTEHLVHLALEDQRVGFGHTFEEGREDQVEPAVR